MNEIIIVVGGGNIQSITANHNVKVIVLDYDNIQHCDSERTNEIDTLEKNVGNVNVLSAKEYADMCKLFQEDLDIEVDKLKNW